MSTDSLYNGLNFNDIFEEYRYIPLRQTEGFIIGKIGQILLFENKIIVVSDGIYCFDFDGNPVYKIDNKGHAKEEYLLCETVSINEGLLYMYDRGKRQMHVYDAQTGRFINNYEVPPVDELYCVGDAFVIEDPFHSCSFTKSSNHRFFVYDKDLSHIQYRVFDKEQDLYNIGSRTSLGNKCVLFCDYMNCRLYKLLSDKVVSYLQIDCDNQYRYTSEEIRIAIDNAKFKKDKLQGLQLVSETKTHICGTFFLHGKLYNFVLDKGSKHSKVFEYTVGMSYQIWHRSEIESRYSSETYVCRSFNAERVYRPQSVCPYGESLPSSHPDYRNQKVLLDCKPDDNPIIALYKFRRF